MNADGPDRTIGNTAGDSILPAGCRVTLDERDAPRDVLQNPSYFYNPSIEAKNRNPAVDGKRCKLKVPT